MFWLVGDASQPPPLPSLSFWAFLIEIKYKENIKPKKFIYHVLNPGVLNLFLGCYCIWCRTW